MQNKSAVLIEDLSTWVYTDIKNYPRLEDIKAHMEKLYPTTYDKHRKCWVQHYRINVSCNAYGSAIACADRIRAYATARIESLLLKNYLRYGAS